ncbi:hypothetical protein V2J09_010463 [Rumex salicifolius]
MQFRVTQRIMGRHTEERNHDGISMDKTNPHRKWVKILNVLDYHRWNYVKKMLPHKKHGEERDGYEATDAGDEKVNVGEKVHACNGDVCTLTFQSSQPEQKATKEAARKGCATRIREKITKEVMKQRLRHRRSSNGSPTTACLNENVSRLEAHLINEQEASHEDSVHSDQSLPVINANFEEQTTKKVDIVDDDNEMQKETQVGEESSDEEEPFPLKMKNIEHLGRSATFDQSKEVMDAMDVLSMNKDFFLKILVDPEASLKQHFMVQHASGKSKLLDKSRTFPRPCPSQENDSSSRLTIKPNGNANFDENNRKSFGHIPKSEVAGKRFKDLRQKIKHVIKEETHRIAMDSVLHKIPYGQQYPESKKDTVEQLSLEMDAIDSPKTSTKKDKKHHQSVNRWPSLNESMERYCRLIETSIANKSKHISSASSLKLRVKDAIESRPWGSLGRISSSPDLFMCLRSPFGESYGASPSMLPKGIPLPRRPMRESRSFNELNTQLMLSCFGKNEIEDEAEETDTFPIADLDENNVTKTPTMRFEESSPDYVEDCGSSKKANLSEDLFSEAENTTDPEKPEAESQDNLPIISHRVIVQSKDQEQFDYVKEALQLSGYLENQALVNWQSQDQPMDSSLFAELEGCSFQEPDYSESEERTRCNRLLLFDSINEVLLSTYERSMAYWSTPLTSCSYIHPMPKGYRVLEMVWSHLSWYLNSAANQLESSLDHVIMHDLGEDDGWMNLQFDAEGTALEIENLIFEDILREVIMPISLDLLVQILLPLKRKGRVSVGKLVISR